MPMAPGTPQHWSQGGPGPQPEMFNRPPPPYPGPGPVRGPIRFPGPFPGDQHGQVAMEGQFPDGANMGMRQHMQRWVSRMWNVREGFFLFSCYCFFS